MFIKKPNAIYEFENNDSNDNLMYILEEVEAYIQDKYNAVKVEIRTNDNVARVLAEEVIQNGLSKYMYAIRENKKEYSLVHVFEIKHKDEYSSFALESNLIESFFVENILEEENISEFQLEDYDEIKLEAHKLFGTSKFDWDENDGVYKTAAITPGLIVQRHKEGVGPQEIEFTEDAIEKIVKKYVGEGYSAEYASYISDGTDGFIKGSWIVMSTDDEVKGKGVSVEFNEKK